MSHPISRRKVVGSSLAAAALGGTYLLSRSVIAQEVGTPPAGATPANATPGGQTESSSSVQVAATPAAQGPAIPPEYESLEGNWISENLDLAATRAAVGSTISSSNIDQLGVAWKLALTPNGTYGAMTSNPLVLDNMLYTQDMASNVSALDKATGEVIWSNEYNVPTVGPNGMALGYGVLAFSLGDTAEVVAVKADSGDELWRVKLSNNMGEGVDMAPLIYDNTVYVSTVPGNTQVFYRGGQKGIIYALDLASGHTMWQFDTTTDNLWGNARVNSGGGLWHPPSIDGEGNVYVGIGNAAPYPGNAEFPAGSSRLGDNDYAVSIVSLNPATGSPNWYLNIKPHDLFDLDNQLTPVLADVNGKKIAITSGKHGQVVGVDRETGKELWRTPVGLHKNDELQELPADDYVEVLPGTLGGVETPMAYAEGVVYAPVFNMSSYYSATALNPESIDISKATGDLVALDAETGKILWDAEQPTGTLAAATVVNDLVFTGGLDGVVRAYSTKDGTQVWAYQASAGLNAPLAVSGDYLFVPAGGAFIPSTDTWNPPPETATELIALKIGGEVQVQGTPQATAQASAEASPASGNVIQVDALDSLKFDPSEFSIAADTDVKIQVTNTGVLQHDFVVENTDFKTKLLNGGEETDLTLNLPAGSYLYYCSVSGHREAGMQGKLTVQ